MSNESDVIPLKSVAEVLCRHAVEFIVIGGQAESLHGSARITYDVDLCYRKSAANLERLAAALREMRVTLRNAPKDLPFQIDARSLALGDNFTFDTPFGDVDFLGYVEPIGVYEDIAKRAEEYPVGPHVLKTISLDDLIRIKEHLQRPKDRDSLLHLRAIRQVRAEMAASPSSDWRGPG